MDSYHVLDTVIGSYVYIQTDIIETHVTFG